MELKRERIKFCAAINMIVGNTLFKMRELNLVNYEIRPLKTQVDCLIRRYQMKFLKDMNIHCTPLVYDFKIRKVKDTMRKFVPRKKYMETL